MGGKNVSTPRGKLATPGRRGLKQADETNSTPNTANRKRRRASDFASKISSKRKRRRSRGEGNVPDVDKLLFGLRDAIDNEGDNEDHAELRNALSRARKAAEQYESGSSSEGEADSAVTESTPKKGQNSPEDKLDGLKSVSKKKIGSAKKKKISNGTPTSDKTTAAVTPQKSEKTPSKDCTLGAKKLKSSVKKARNGGSKGKSFISKTASAHKADIQALKQEDPDFYKFLEENDATLLDFDLDGDELPGDDEGKNQDEPHADAPSTEKRDPERKDLNMEEDSGGDKNSESDSDEEMDDVVNQDSKRAAISDADEHKHGNDQQPKIDEVKAKESTVIQSDSEDSLENGSEVNGDSGSEADDKLEAKNSAAVISDSENSAENESEDNIDSGCEAANEQIAKESVVNGDAVQNSSESESEESDDSDGQVETEEVGDGKRTYTSSKVDEVDGYSDDSDLDEDSKAEAEAAAEAGLELSIDNNSEEEGDEVQSDSEVEDENPGKTVKTPILVDMAYLRYIKEQLKSNRSCLRAAKDLLRLFRAGRDVLPSKQAAVGKKDKLNKNKVRRAAQNDARGEEALNEMEDDQFADDGSFTSGQVKFISAKAYQHAMNLAITGVQDALDRMLGKPQSKKGSSAVLEAKWDPSQSNRWSNLQPVFRPFVFHMISLCDATVDPKTLRFLLKRLEKLVPFTRDNKELLKKIIRTAVRVWSSNSLHVSEATRLRAYLLLNKLAHGPDNAEAVLRSCCSVYTSSIGVVCNPRTLPRINFATSCIVELFGVDMGASYTTAFANLREMSVSLRAVLVSKDEKDEVERIHNWAYINRLRLWSAILGRYGSEDELRPLIYPYVQVALGVMRVHATPRTFPMRLHVASYLSNLVAESGVFIPLVPHLLHLLRCSELRKKPEHGSAKPLEWRSSLRVSNEAIKTKPFLSGVINGVVLQVAKFFSTISKHVSFPEVVHVAEITLRKFAKEVQVSEWKGKIMALVEKLRQTSQIISDARAKADFSPHGAISAEGMLATVPGLSKEAKMPIQRFYDVECDRIAKEEKLRDEKVTANKMAGNDAGHTNGRQKVESDSESEAVPSRPKKSGAQGKKKPTLSIVDSQDEEEDQIEALNFDSDDSEE